MEDIYWEDMGESISASLDFAIQEALSKTIFAFLILFSNAS